MSALTAGQVQALIRLGVPMAEDIDLHIDHLDVDKAVARVPFHSKLVRPGGTLSGPTIMALADAAMPSIAPASKIFFNTKFLLAEKLTRKNKQVSCQLIHLKAG